MKGQKPMIKYAAVALALSQALMFGQDGNREPTSNERITKVIHVHYVRAEAVRDLIQHSVERVTANNGLNVLVVRSSPSSVAAAEQTVKELDVMPPSELSRNVEVTVYVIGAAKDGTESNSGPAEIEPVVRQLKAVFPYGSYQLLDSMMIRSREGKSARSQGLLKNFPNAQTAFLSRYNVDCELEARGEAGSDRTIRLNRFSFSTGVPPNPDIRVSVDTNLDVQDGQKVVVGNTNIDGGNSALFVVVTAKF